MEIVIYILTFFLVVDCLFLGLLIPMQLPKKEAGLGGTAFGGGAVDGRARIDRDVVRVEVPAGVLDLLDKRTDILEVGGLECGGIDP